MQHLRKMGRHDCECADGWRVLCSEFKRRQKLQQKAKEQEEKKVRAMWCSAQLPTSWCPAVVGLVGAEVGQQQRAKSCSREPATAAVEAAAAVAVAVSRGSSSQDKRRQWRRQA